MTEPNPNAALPVPARFCAGCGARALQADENNATPAGAFNCEACGNPFFDHPDPSSLQSAADAPDGLEASLISARIPPEIQELHDAMPPELRTAMTLLRKLFPEVFDLLQQLEALRDQVQEVDDDLDELVSRVDVLDGGPKDDDNNDGSQETPAGDATTETDQVT